MNGYEFTIVYTAIILWSVFMAGLMWNFRHSLEAIMVSMGGWVVLGGTLAACLIGGTLA